MYHDNGMLLNVQKPIETHYTWVSLDASAVNCVIQLALVINLESVHYDNTPIDVIVH